MDGRNGGSARCTDRFGTLQSICMASLLPMTTFHPNAGMGFPQNLGPSVAGRELLSPHSTHFSINAGWITGPPCRAHSRDGPAVRASAPTCRGDAFRWPQRFAHWRSGSPHSGRPPCMVRTSLERLAPQFCVPTAMALPLHAKARGRAAPRI